MGLTIPYGDFVDESCSVPFEEEGADEDHDVGFEAGMVGIGEVGGLEGLGAVVDGLEGGLEALAFG